MAQEEPDVLEAEEREKDATRIRTDLVGRLQEAGGPITVVGSKVADDLGIPVAVFRSHLKDLVASGQLVKLAAGLSGTTLALPGMLAEGGAAAESEPAPTRSETLEVPLAEAPDERREDRKEEDAATAPAASADDDGATTRQRIRDVIRAAVLAGHGETILTTQRIAAIVGASTATVAYHMRRMANGGDIATASAGRAGTRILLGGGTRKAGPGPMQGTRASGGRGAAAGFCPWCAHMISDRAWRFCQGCGEELPHSFTRAAFGAEK